MLEVTKNAPQMAIIQLGAAFKNFFAGRAKYPKFIADPVATPVTQPVTQSQRLGEPQEGEGKTARLHARIGNIRSDALHQITTNLSRRFHTIGIEDLNLRGMVKNRHLSRAVSDMGFFEFRRKLDYKVAQRGGMIVVADRWYPSSKTCSAYGHKLETLPLSVREWTCPAPGPLCGA